MRIVIDMQGAQTESRFRGIGRYTMSFAQAVVRNRGEHEVILALNGLFPDTIEPIRTAFADLLPQENIRVWHVPGPVQEDSQDNDSRRETAELLREAFLARLRPDVIHVSSFFEGFIDDAITSIGRFDRSTPVSVSLYDLIPLLNPDHYLKSNLRYAQYYRRKVEYLKKAAVYLAISEFSRQEGLTHLDTPASRVVNVGTAIESCFQSCHTDAHVAVRLRQKFGLTRPFILYTGGADERKNLPRLIAAFAALPDPLRASHQLLLAGKVSAGNISGFKRLAKNAGLKLDELRFTGYVTDAELVHLYNICKLFVFPSWHEGFGLPALEAMACGAPVIGANTSSLPEVIALEEAMFDPHDVASIATKIAEALQDDVFRTKLREHGLRQARKFSWDTSAKRALTAFEQLYTHQRKVVSRRYCGEEILQRLIAAVARNENSSGTPEPHYAEIAVAIARNHPEPGRRPRIFVDISELVQRDARTGIQRVTRAILHELLSDPPNDYLVEAVYSTLGSRKYKQATTIAPQFTGGAIISARDTFIEPHAGDIFLGLDLQPQIVIECRNYYRDLRRQGVRVFFVVYDLLPVNLPHAFPPGTSKSHANWLQVVTEADGAICISKSVAEEVRNWMASQPQPGNRSFALRWFHLGADILNSVPSGGLPPESNEVLSMIHSQPAFLMVGTVEPRKGHQQALAAFSSLWRQGVDVALVLVGKRGWDAGAVEESLLNHSERGKRLIWLEGISDEYLEAVYAASTCLLASSEGEGFGLPLIEAAQHGVPIIARDLPVFREVAGKNAFYFSGKAPEDLIAAVKKWLSLHRENEVPSSAYINWQTWAKSAKQLVAALLGEEVSISSGKDAAQRLLSAQDTSTTPRHRRPSALLLAPYPIRRPRHGGQLRTAAIQKAFEDAGFVVQVIGFYQAEAYAEADLGELDIAFPAESPFRIYRGECLPALSDFLMADFAVSDAGAFKQVVQRIVSDIDVIIAEQPWFYPLAQRLKCEVPECRASTLVFSSQNIESSMKQQILESLSSSKVIQAAVADIAAMERTAAQKSDLSVAVTREDADVLRDYGATNVLVAANGINPWFASPARVEFWRDRLPSQPWPLFIASAHPPNYTGFINAVGDSLACIPPASKLVVAGGVGPHLLQELTNTSWREINISRIEVLGVLDDIDLAAVKNLAHSFLLPIGAGGGSNIKAAEALYSGKPVICTSTALRGFNAYRSLPQVFVADTPQAFQAAVRSVLGGTSEPEPESDIHTALRQQLTWEASLRMFPQEVLRLIQERRNI